MKFVYNIQNNINHVWESSAHAHSIGLADEDVMWPCGAMPANENPAACGYKRCGDNVRPVSNEYHSLEAFINDPETCNECARQVVSRLNMPLKHVRVFGPLGRAER